MLTLPLWFLLAALILLGAIWGSFVAALCSRWPKGESVAAGRSRCDRCNLQIASYDLLPIVSFILLRGKCRTCKEKIDRRSTVIELAAILVAAIPLLLLPASQAVATAIFGWLLLPLIVLDLTHLWLPNRLIVSLALVGLAVGPALTTEIAFADRMIGFAAGFLSLEIIRRGYKYLRHNDGMGQGDPKLFGVLGIWLGWQTLPIALLIASVIGLTWTVVMRGLAGNARTALPFGAYLGIAAYLAVLQR